MMYAWNYRCWWNTPLLWVTNNRRVHGASVATMTQDYTKPAMGFACSASFREASSEPSPIAHFPKQERRR